ncbi:MAG: hypothetical protein NTV61_07525 [Candidatus Bathyarchaeota archaeon]|nr:hypothetical protein [Candidatus Bathyarchaeota archaeon]
MGEQATITAKIPVEHREKLRKHGVNINRLINDAIAREVHRLDEEEYQAILKEASKILRKIPEDHLVALIRSGRDER